MSPVLSRIFSEKSVRGLSGHHRPLKGGISWHEGEFISQLIRNDSSVVRTLEVGGAQGISSLFICNSLRDRAGAHHTIIDPFQKSQYDSICIENLRADKIDFFELVEEGSEIALPKLLASSSSRFDLIFIDGWHTFDHTMLDLFYASALLRIGGYLVIDDINWPSVNRAYRYFESYPCYSGVGEVPNDLSEISRTRRVLISMIRLVPDTILRRVLTISAYLHVSRRTPSMVALQKISKDDRSYSWYSDSFCR